MQTMRLVLITIAFVAATEICTGQSPQPDQINIDLVKGKLHPTFGKVLEIRGRWYREKALPGQLLKDPELFLIVESVNQKKLEPPQQFREQFVYFYSEKHQNARRDDQEVTYRVYEGIRTAGIPREAMEIILPRPVNIAFGVYSTIYVLDNNEVGTNEPAPPKKE